VNVDVANSTFWTAQDVHQAARNMLSRGNQRFDYTMMYKRLESVPYGKGWTQSEDFKELRKMQKIKFKVKWFPKGDTSKYLSPCGSSARY
jgi:eukaryotic translation initiation factor 2C